ncbi:hypothetical protein D9758_005759 [Tetrapyrgos nigripes]|uniref:SWIM-type domain-containing protein n=1 Tax=Tetrapyrgos nigripes TaxID=182062 RepID=A0A8H5LQU4_9AGAR|nr:hypothetical protein D9758_005759 [Tetrapyrgos nigripes]
MDSTAASQDSTEDLQWCTGCSMRKPLSLFKKGASTAKTCAGCRGRPSQVKKKPKITSNSTVDDNDPADSLLDLPLVSFSDFIRTIESVQGIHSFAAQVSLKEEQLGNTSRAKADHIASSVWNATGLRFIYHKTYSHRNTPSANVVYHCAQQAKRQHKSTASARDKGQMHTFDCKGWLRITVFDDAKSALVRLQHEDDHILYDGSDVPSNVKDYVEKNFKMSTNALWSEILQSYPNPLFKRRSIASIAADVRRSQWCRDPDELKSARIILEESKAHSLWSICEANLPTVDGYSGIAFSLPDVLQRFGGTVREVSLDSAWNTNGSRYELYALLGEVYGSGCPLGFLLLQSPQKGDAGVKEDYILCFLEHFKTKYALDPLFTLSDKDLSEINAFLKAFPSSKHQLCFWHCLRAVKQRLSILRRPPKFYDVTKTRNEFGDEIDKNFVPVGQVNEADRVDFPMVEQALPRVTVRLQGVLQNTAPPKPRLVIRINGLTRDINPDSENPTVESGYESAEIQDNDEEDGYCQDPDYSALFDFNNTDDEYGPDWMFDESEKPSKDPLYVFCPAPHRKQLLHLFTRHFCQHPLFPERLEEDGWTADQIRRNAVIEMYRFCYQRGLREVWGYMWTSWYSPKMWKLWARSTQANLLSRLRTTMNVENFWKQLKHDNLHHILHPRLDQLVWILINEVVPTYGVRIQELKMTMRLGTSRSLSPFQKSFKKDWNTLSKQKIPSPNKYTTHIHTWTCNCGQQKYNAHCLCKHLVQAVSAPLPIFFQQVIQRRVHPFYRHPMLVPKGHEYGQYTKVEDGSITEGDDQDWTGDVSQLSGGAWREIVSDASLGKRRHSSAFSNEASTRPPSPEYNVPADVELTSDAFSGRSSSPIDYDGSDNEQELEKYVGSAEDMIQNLRRAADLIEAQLPYRNFPWLKALNDGKLGKEAHHFVADIAGFEDSHGVRPTTWASSSSKAAKRVERNTLGYQVQRMNE